MPRLRTLDAAAVERTLATARHGERKRANLNLHPTLEDPIQRMLNVFQPSSYVRPHRHERGRFELFLILTGIAAVVVFDEAGQIEASTILRPSVRWAVEIPGGCWHTLFALAPDTALFEVKPGPYRPLEDKDYAPWAPREGTPEAVQYLAVWRRRMEEPSAVDDQALAE